MRSGREKALSPSDIRLISRTGYRPDRSLSLFGASSIGIAVFDRKFHYCAINSKLAEFDRFPPEAHLGKTLDPFVGKLSALIGSRIESVFITETPLVGYELSGKLPKRDDLGYWIEDYLPLYDRRGRIAQVCTVVVEITAEKRLERTLSDLRNKTLRQLMFMTGRTQRTLKHWLKWHSSRATSQAATDRNLEAFRQLERGYQRVLAQIVEAVSAARNEPQSGGEVAPGNLPLRQRTIIQLLAKGESPKEIAGLLNLSPRTVETHKARICKKLGFNSLAHLIQYAIKTGLVEL